MPTRTRFVYFDTNIISNVAKDRTLWNQLSNFLAENDLTLGISEGQIAELADAKRLHQSLPELWVSLQAVVIKNAETILQEEIEAYPQMRTESLAHPSSPLKLGQKEKREFEKVLSSKELKRARAQQLSDARQMKKILIDRKSNFPPTKSGVYTPDQADFFAWAIVVQWLSQTHREFISQFKDDASSFRSETIRSRSLFAYVVFYKYYIGKREPTKLSDFGDFFHLPPLPYCELAVMERDLCDTLNQIKRNHDILASTTILNSDFFAHWTW